MLQLVLSQCVRRIGTEQAKIDLIPESMVPCSADVTGKNFLSVVNHGHKGRLTVVNTISDMCMIEDSRGSSVNGFQTTRKLTPIGVCWGVSVGHHISLSR